MPFTRGFKTRRDLEEHFDDHGAEFLAATEEDYETLADAFLGGPQGTTTLECRRRKDGALIRYDYVTQAYAVQDADGYILTYFKPTPAWHGKSTNRAYFDWDCGRRA